MDDRRINERGVATFRAAEWYRTPQPGARDERESSPARAIGPEEERASRLLWGYRREDARSTNRDD